MFRKITLKNFRTHVNTTIELGPLCLLIGGNNAGKSNFIAGISHFSKLIARAMLVDEFNRPINKEVTSEDFFPYRHRLTSPDEPMGFSCEWLGIKYV